MRPIQILQLILYICKNNIKDVYIYVYIYIYIYLYNIKDG